jgi:hypothetical protein
MTVGTTSISQLGTAGLVADGSETAAALANGLPASGPDNLRLIICRS